MAGQPGTVFIVERHDGLAVLSTPSYRVCVVGGADEGKEAEAVDADGDEVVESSCPAVVTISNELGQPRYLTAARTIAARRMQPTVVSVEDLSLRPEHLQPRVTLTQQFVPTIQGNCEFISGETPAEVVDNLVKRLREDRVLE